MLLHSSSEPLVVAITPVVGPVDSNASVDVGDDLSHATVALGRIKQYLNLALSGRVSGARERELAELVLRKAVHQCESAKLAPDQLLSVAISIAAKLVRGRTSLADFDQSVMVERDIAVVPEEIHCPMRPAHPLEPAGPLKISWWLNVLRPLVTNVPSELSENRQ